MNPVAGPVPVEPIEWQQKRPPARPIDEIEPAHGAVATHAFDAPPLLPHGNDVAGVCRHGQLQDLPPPDAAAIAGIAIASVKLGQIQVRRGEMSKRGARNGVAEKKAREFFLEKTPELFLGSVWESRLLLDQPAAGGPEVRRGVVPELGDQRMLVECLLDDAALNAAAAAVNETQLPQAGLVRGADVFVDDGGNVARREGVQVELRLDRDPMRHDVRRRRGW